MGASRLAQVEREMLRYKIEVLGLSEVRWRGCGEMTTANGGTFIYSGLNNNSGTSGVGFLMSKEVKRSLLDWCPISDRIITMRVRTKARNLNFVQCYAPTEQAAAAEKDAFYETLALSLNELNRGEIIVLMGDFNAQVGSDNSGLEHIMGKHGLGNRNDNGDRFIELCQQNKLVIGGTIFPHKFVHKYTWSQPGIRGARNQIDHIGISKEWRRSLLDVRTRRGADAHSDHELLVAVIQLRLAATKRRTTQRRLRFRTDLLKSQEYRTAYLNRLRELTTTLDWREAHMTAAADILGTHEQRPSEKWISDKTWGLIEERRVMKQWLNLTANPLLQRQYAEKNKQVKRSARQDKRRFMDKFAQEAEDAAKQYDLKTLYRKVKVISSKNRTTPNQPIKDRNGRYVASTDQQLERWKEHFEGLLNDGNIETESDQPYIGPSANINTNSPTLAEIVRAIKKLKTNKAAGTDGIPAELMLADPQTTAAALSPHIAEAWNTENFDADWKRGFIVKLPKKGDLRDCNNWRGITILNVINKIMALIIHGRINDHLDAQLRDEQAGFRANRGCIDQSNTIRLIVEQSVEYRSPLCMVFVDFEKAFDRITREAIWTTLAKRGIPVKIINLVKALYSDAKCSVMHRGQLSDEFNINSGVRQGCVLSPLLFITVLDEVMREAALSGQQGIWWTLTRKLDDLDFADDVCLLSNTISGMQTKLQRLYEAGLRRGLKINLGKTKLMKVNIENSTAVTINGTAIEEVSEFCYLGSTITRSGGTDADINSRIKKARDVYGGLSRVWNASTISHRTKLSIFKSCVLSVLLYGSETWRIVDREVAKIQSFVNRCLRRILRIFWPNTISNEDLHTRADMEPIATIIKKRKWRWIGHTLRRPDTSTTRQALDWNPQGTRRRGRPSKTWRRTINQELEAANATWNDARMTAGNRVRWRAFSEALCSHRR